MLEFGFYNMDCMEGMKDMPDKSIDLAICDPPYGINVGQSSMGAGGGVAPHRNRAAVNARRAEGTRRTSRSAESATQNMGVRVDGAKPFGKNQSGGGLVVSPKIYKAFDDSHTPDAAYFKELERVAKRRIIFGGNYFLDHLGATSCLIVWDKRRRGLNFADCEIAWTDIKEPCRIYEFKWNGMLQEDMTNKEYRIHPTQKPVELYKWILNHYAKPGDIILDTHVGSASSLVACREMGFKYIGFEIDEDKLFDQYDNHTIAEITGRTIKSVEQHRHALKLRKEEKWGKLCPICGRRFDPISEEWVYKIATKDGHKTPVCSWKCMRSVK